MEEFLISDLICGDLRNLRERYSRRGAEGKEGIADVDEDPPEKICAHPPTRRKSVSHLIADVGETQPKKSVFISFYRENPCPIKLPHTAEISVPSGCRGMHGCPK
jgi:hypothetical protein